MGKLELLDTPNGKIAKELVEANYPLFVSSRAAGDVDEKTHEVSIAQIFTYDIVCTPGFEEARLDRVNESALSDVTKNFLNESASIKKGKKTMNEKLGVTTKNVEVYEINEEVDINEKVSNMSKGCGGIMRVAPMALLMAGYRDGELHFTINEMKP